MSKGTTNRTIRVDDSLWVPAKTKAEDEGINVSDIIREALRKFLAEPPADT